MSVVHLTEKIKIGTSGYSYKDWIGPFYPEGTKSHQMLAYYACFFDTVELNFTYYTLPSAENLNKMVVNSDGKVEFVVKSHQSITHQRDSNWKSQIDAFYSALGPLFDSQTLGSILYQFPYSFQLNRENGLFLLELRDVIASFPPHRVAIEFRHRSWLHERVFNFLEESAWAFCCVDEPQLANLMPPQKKLTAPFGYVRFHGRNAAKWWNHDHAWERYDYLYSEEELEEWVEPILTMAAQSEKMFLFSNNHYQGNAVTNAKMLRDRLADFARKKESDIVVNDKNKK